MKQPERLADAGADEFERGLLSSSHADAPSERAYQRTLASLGVGLLVPLGAASVAHGAGSSAAVTSKLGVAALGKWLVTGMALGAVTVSAVAVTGRARSTPPERVATEQAPMQRRDPSATTARSGSAAALAPPPAPREVPRPASEAVAPKRRPDTSARSAQPVPATPASSSPDGPEASEPLPSVPSVKRETELIGTAQRALQRGDGQSALDALERYRAEFPHGALGPEARLLGIAALLRTGQRDRARTVAADVIAREPTGQEAAAARALLQKSDRP